ncbi:minor tail protein [Gordonia phage Trine]|uniref:Minor tail protein n=1 Tax=Gordonia phage Trine TaxID=2201431 RepID=A0A2Z4Q979_9CAUD|nr:minor tail protein [Gordonia phage Trine]AWY06520.1 minor tail protein [Gordonia phage Trine]
MPTATELRLDDVRQVILKRKQEDREDRLKRPVVCIRDEYWDPVCYLRGELSASFEEIANDTGEGEITIPASHLLTEWLLDPARRLRDVHITVDTTYKRWGGKADYIRKITKSGELAAVQVHFLHDYNRAKKITCFANPAFPAEIQTPKAMPWAGPSVTGITTYGITNNARINLGLWEIPANIFDPGQWVAGWNASDWWTQFVPINPLTDTSKWTVMSSRFANFHDLVKPTLADAQVHLEVTRWFPGEPWPMPDFVSPPDHSVRLFKAVDKSGYAGPTGTLVDGLLNLVGTTAEDYINELITLAARPNVPEYKLPKWFGTHQDAPFVVFPEGKYSRTASTETTIHKAMAYAMVTGGKSPQWVNSAAKLAANAALGYLGAAIGNPGLALGVFDFLLEDVLLAFHRTSNTMLKNQMGPDADPEAWVQGPGVGFTLSTLQAIRTGFWDNRGYTAYKAEIEDGAPWRVGKHFDLGDRVAFDIGGQLYVDNVRSLKIAWDRSTPPVWEISVGDDTAEEEPAAKLMRYKEQIFTLLQQQGVEV